jgi:hypothetical protein
MNDGQYIIKAMMTSRTTNGMSLRKRRPVMRIYGILERYGLQEAEELVEPASMLWETLQRMQDLRGHPRVEMTMQNGHEVCRPQN